MGSVLARKFRALTKIYWFWTRKIGCPEGFFSNLSLNRDDIVGTSYSTGWKERTEKATMKKWRGKLLRKQEHAVVFRLITMLTCRCRLCIDNCSVCQSYVYITWNNSISLHVVTVCYYVSYLNFGQGYCATLMTHPWLQVPHKTDGNTGSLDSTMVPWVLNKIDSRTRANLVEKAYMWILLVFQLCD